MNDPSIAKEKKKKKKKQIFLGGLSCAESIKLVVVEEEGWFGGRNRSFFPTQVLVCIVCGSPFFWEGEKRQDKKKRKIQTKMFLNIH